MTLKRLVQPATLAMMIGAGLALPAAAQQGNWGQQQVPYQNQAPAMRNGTFQPGIQNGGNSVTALRNWNYDNLYNNGWSAERLMDNADVVGAEGDDIGSVENIIVSNGGQILGIIAQVGGFWDIGDTHVFVPWNELRISPTLARVMVPITEDNVDDYSAAADSILTRRETGQARVVDDDLATGSRIWKATDLIDDYAYLNGNAGYGYVNDLIFGPSGKLEAVVVNASSGYGGGYRAFPFYGYDYGWSPGVSYYNLQYGNADVRNLGAFDYNQLPTRVGFGNRTGVSSRMQTGAATATTGAVPTQWTFQNVDSDRNLELTGREFASAGNNIYNRWDANRDGRIQGNEFFGGLYNVFDTNRDGRVAQNEFDTNWRDWGRNAPQVSFRQLDANNDGILDRNEFGRGLYDTGYLSGWDRDGNGLLARNEFDDGLFGIWDSNGDGLLAQNEYNGFYERNWF